MFFIFVFSHVDFQGRVLCKCKQTLFICTRDKKKVMINYKRCLFNHYELKCLFLKKFFLYKYLIINNQSFIEDTFSLYAIFRSFLIELWCINSKRLMD